MRPYGNLDFFSGYFGERVSETTDAHAGFWPMVKSHFLALAGIELDYYGADSGELTFNIDEVVFKVLEDPDDGYRSYLGALEYTDDHNSIFFQTPIAHVRMEVVDIETLRGYQLIDVSDSHIWLQFGTNYSDSYYPHFVFRHRPKAPS